MVMKVSAHMVYERVFRIRGGVTGEVLLGCGAMSSPLSLPYQRAVATADALRWSICGFGVWKSAVSLRF